MTVMTMGVLAFLMITAIVMRPPALAAALLIGVSIVTVFATVASRVRGYTLTEQAITVHRGLWDTTLPLMDLRSITGDVEAMRGSIRVLGNGGVFSFTGRFWNTKLGWYRAYATDPSRAVVLRYPKRTIVITPHDPQHFIMRARTLLKAADFPK